MEPIIQTLTCYILHYLSQFFLKKNLVTL